LTTDIKAQDFIENIKNYDLIIDARSPAEFAYSHIPNAVNFFALNDAEHQEIGTVHKQISPFEARVKGAAYVCKNAVAHIQSLYEAVTPSAKIAIHCAKGGMRSSSLATIFSSIGYRIDRVDGGYKSYRACIVPYIERFEDFRFITLTGHTGCGKSELLESLENVVDLEKMANHYGSVFGAARGEQPSQKEFQNRLAHAFLDIDKKYPAFIEAESKKIGQIALPPTLHENMAKGFLVEITAPLEQRVERIVQMYSHIGDDFFAHCMERITPYIKHTDKEDAVKAYSKGDLEKVSEILLVKYYDNVYKKALQPNMIIHNDDPQKTVKILRELQKEKANV
jgi:tRNA 2-selenouridine synthase